MGCSVVACESSNIDGYFISVLLLFFKILSLLCNVLKVPAALIIWLSVALRNSPAEHASLR